MPCDILLANTTESIINTLTELYPDVEFDVCEGKQPVYHYIISLE